MQAETTDPAAAARVVGAGNGVVSLSVGRNLLRVEVSVPGGEARGIYEIAVVRAHPTPSWKLERPSCPWAPRDSAGELVFGGRMWLFGGYTPELVSDVWASADGTVWSRVGAIPTTAGINIPVTFAHEGRMWVAANDGVLFSSSDGASWTVVTERAPWSRRYAAGAAVFAGRMWVAGGLGPDGLCNDVWSSADGVEWALETAEAPWSRRQVFGMLVAHRDCLWLLGGGVTAYHPFRGYTDVWRSADGREWTWVAEAPWPARIWSSAVSYRDRIWVLGGFRSEPTWNNFDDLWYSADGVAWRRLACAPVWSPRHELSPYVFDDRLWVVAGNAWPLTNDVWSLAIGGLTFTTSPRVEEFVGARYTYPAAADFNRSGQPVRFRLLRAPAWLAMDPVSGMVSGIAAATGEYPVELEAFDASGETCRQAFTLHVIPVG